nr:hypothetical protein B0A51_07329 [Rachicladosporium sp. CCFEE 5018]OQO30991.1 hypothetical protein B0A51_01230 [Rachicladosporium sp. CCFEE 5018]
MGLFDTEDEDVTRELRYPKNIGALYTAGGDHDSYWRMAHYQFVKKTELLNLAQTRGMKHLEILSVEELKDRHCRFSRGDLVYDNCDVEEICGFLQQRSITAAFHAEDHRAVGELKSIICGLGAVRFPFEECCPIKRVLIRRLHATDDSAVFNRLRDLPSELRSIIYDLYCSGFPEQELHAPTQPPLARVCRQLRQEVLPVFYSQCTFRIYASYPLPICQLELKSALFFADIDPGHLALIMSLQICIPQEDEDYSDVGTMNFIDAEVKIAKDRATYEVRVNEELHCWLNIKSLDECTTEQERCDMVQRPVQSKLQSVMDSVVGRGQCGGKLCKTDIHRLAWALQEACADL